MVKVLYLPLNYGEVVQTGVYDAFRDSGCELKVFDYMNKYLSNKNLPKIRAELIDVAAGFKPDLMFMMIQHTNIIDAKTVRAVKLQNKNCKIVNWTGDVRAFIPPTYKRIAAVSDYNMISSTGQIAMFEAALKKKVHYLQIGFNPKLYYPEQSSRTSFDYDAIFIGNYSAKEKYPDAPLRTQICKKLSAAFGSRFCLFGSGWPKNLKSKGSMDQKRLREFYTKSLCLISVNHFNDINHYFSDRLLMCMACGRPTISYRFPKWDSYFTDMGDLVIAEDANDVVNKVKMLKQNIELANFIGENGMNKVFAEHTYLSRVQELLEIVELK